MLRTNQRRTLVASIDPNNQEKVSASTLQWVRALSGEFADQEQPLNARPCYLREDGARIYWEAGGFTKKRGWWIHDKAFAVYAYHAGEDRDAPEDGWQCPGKLYMYVKIDLKVRSKDLRSQTRIRLETSCMQGLRALFTFVSDADNQQAVVSGAAGCASGVGAFSEGINQGCGGPSFDAEAQAERQGNVQATRAISRIKAELRPLAGSQLKAALRRLQLEWHPDKATGDEQVVHLVFCFIQKYWEKHFG